ncbi:receptor-like protein kinase 7 isoform X2 [Henckelia pumila]|uniref:receptor-like protein kinase 7 isoform X2 n=1 Tax=Henckelia pumila TaxID=405737 RepID=UPI003C6E3349
MALAAATVYFHFLFLFLCLLSLVHSDELQTLLSIKSAFHGSHTKIFDSWNLHTPVCNFSTITCDSHGFVKEIDLSNQNLYGFLPVNAICNLTSLEKLSLGFNSIHGPVTQDFTSCTSSLNYLDLGNNFFSGPFPDISSLTGIVSLYANNSGFSGIFPWDSLQNMTNLVALSLGDNAFDLHPFPHVILNLTNLNWLYLSNCSIQGQIPEHISNLLQLINLELAQNSITGNIPHGITKLNKLWQLELYRNELTGEFPSGMGNLTNLENFDASANHLSGSLSEIRFMHKLRSVHLYQNQLSGEIPAEFGDFKNLVNLSLYGNNLSGKIPQNLGSSAEIFFIDVSENFFSGSIPPHMCKMGTTKKLALLQNNLTGQIPGTYANCTTLIRFRVSKNQLSGHVPAGIWGLPNAEIIDLADNKIEGPITSDIGKARNLVHLFLANNRFSGELPSEISKASSLVSIDLSYNQFSGEIPVSIGELKQLNTIQFQVNQFSGSIPDSLHSSLSINDINMAFNSLSGRIPASLGTLSALNFLNLSRNQLSGPIPETLSSLRLNLLDLSYNRLTGPIPESLLIEANNGSFLGNRGLCTEKIKGFRRCSREYRMSKYLVAVLLCLVVAAIAWLVSMVAFFLLKRKSEHGEERSLKDDSWDLKSFHILTFTEDDILDSIKPENLIGRGGSGNVYKVVVRDEKVFAVKHILHSHLPHNALKKMGSSTRILERRGTRSREFESEVETLSSIRHINVVKLYCSITSEDSSLLVYEYMPNGSLWDRLHTSKKFSLDWDARLEIALGAAKGLEYLHHGCDRPIIHRDVKSSNILLDELLKPRIADFGLAKIVQASSTDHESTQTFAGTHGYIAPGNQNMDIRTKLTRRAIYIASEWY